MNKTLRVGAACLGIVISAALLLNLDDQDSVQPETQEFLAKDARAPENHNLHQQSTLSDASFVVESPKNDNPKPEAINSALTETSPISALHTSVLALSQLASEELRLEESLSSHNLMVIKDLAARIHDLSSNSEQTIQLDDIALGDFPEEFRDTLTRIFRGMQAENALNTEWQTRILQDPEAYKVALLATQSEVLGEELYQQLYGEDLVNIDQAGLSGHVDTEIDQSLKKDSAHQQKLALITQWQHKEINDVELKASLENELDHDEIEQLMASIQHESEWLNKIDGFLEEYRYIELSGISGEDEQQMRRELLEKHFPKEERAIVNQFLFKAN